MAVKIIDELPAQIDHYQFCQALIQQSLAAELSTSRNAQIHGRIAHALERLYHTNAETHAAQLVRHLAEAETVLGIEKLGKYCLLLVLA